MRQRLCALVLLAFLGMAGASALASQPDPFAAGVAAFREGDFLRALAYFQQARRDGAESASLYYNLGVTYYRLARYDDARRIFTLMQRRGLGSPALVSYNLGLVARAQDKTAEAADRFAAAHEAADTGSRLRQLAGRALSELDRGGSVSSAADGGAGIALGYDDNVAFEPADERAGMGDGFLEAFGWGHYGWSMGDGHRLRLEARYYGLAFAEHDEYNLSDLRLGSTWLRRTGPWRWSLAGSWDRLWQDGQYAVDSVEARGVLRRSLAAQWRTRIAYSATRYAAASRYDYLDGWRHELVPAVTYDGIAGWWRLRYRWRWNDRRDSDYTQQYFSYSPQSHGLLVDGRWALAPRWSVSAGARWRYERYADPDVWLTDDGSRVERRRSDRYAALELRLSRALAAGWRVFVEARQMVNDSNIPDRDYRRRVVTVGARWRVP